MIVYEFNILALTKQTINNVDDTIIRILWEKIGCDADGISGSYKVVTTLDTSTVGSNEAFVNYNDVRKQDVIEWIKSLTNEDDINSSILEEIEKLRQNFIQITSGDLPWDPIKNDFEILMMTKKTVNDIPNTVLSVEWKKTGTDADGFSETMQVRTDLNTSQVGISTDYIDYSDLTEDIVKAWIESYLDMSDVDNEINRRITENREDLVQVANDKLPWKIAK